MSLINVDTIESRVGGPPTLSKGVLVSAAATFSGDLTRFDGAVSIGGTLTYEDVTNVDAIGIVTARKGINVTAGGLVVTAGVSTLGGNLNMSAANIVLGDSGGATDDRIVLGASSDLSIYHDASDSYIKDAGTGKLRLLTDSFRISNAADSENMVAAEENGAVSLFYDNVKRIETTSSGAITTGIHTVTVGTDLDGYKVEEGSYDTNALNGEFDFELENGHVQTHTGSTAGTYFPDFRVSSSQSLSSVMGVGDVVSATLIVTASNTAHYCTAGIKIDNSTSNVTIEWIGSSAPSAGKGAGYDIYSFTIQKTAATPAYLVIVNATDAG